jgi:hypothetical protein
MRRRSGQNGTIVIQSGWYRVRWRMDVEGQQERINMTAKIAPVAFDKEGRPKPASPEIRRKAREIVEQSGANSESRFIQVVVGEVTFREQAEKYLKSAVSRKRNPLRDTVSVEGALNKWVYPAIGDMPLSQVDNLTLKPLIEKMSGSLSARTVNKYVEYVKQVVKSLKAPNGEPVFNRTWDAETMDLPIVEYSEQKRPSLKATTVSGLITGSTGQEQALYVLLAATGMRISEALGLEVRHIINWPHNQSRTANRKGPSSNREISQDQCVKERNRPAPGCRRVPAAVHSLKLWAVVSHRKWQATPLRKSRRSLAHASSRQIEIGRERNGLARIQTIP